MSSTNWSVRLRRTGIAALFLFVLSYQLRSSIETIHLWRSLDFYVPFSVEPFSDKMENVSPNIASGDAVAKTFPLYRDAPLHLLAVNHRQFRGMSGYLTQLWNLRPSIGVNSSFQISVRYGESKAFTAGFIIPHCTCGTASIWQLAPLFFIPPLFCVLFAFFMLLRRPGALHVWGMAALLLSASQLDLSAHTWGFLTVNTMAWNDWFRIPGTAYRGFAQWAWAPGLIIAAPPLFFQHAGGRLFRWFAALLFGWCLLQSLLAVAWSENYLPFVSVYGWLERHGAELTAATLISVAILCFLCNRVMGAVAFVFALAAASFPYWPAQRITNGHASDVPGINALGDFLTQLYPPYRQFVPNVPAPIVSPSVIVPAFAAAILLLIATFQFRRMKRIVLVSLLFLLPPVIYVLGVLNGNVDLRWSWAGLVCMLLCTGVGFSGICVHCLAISGGGSANN